MENGKYIISFDETGAPYLAHYGVQGQKWGMRRYQNQDGSLTTEGYAHYGYKGPRSVSGNIHRVLAGNYNLNAKFYDKLGNKTAASMNRLARNEQLKKASQADINAYNKKQARRESVYKKKEDKIGRKLDKYQKEVDEFNKKTLSDREKNRAKLAAKAEKSTRKVEKAQTRVVDFDKGTDYVKRGQSRVNGVISDYRRMRVSAVRDPSIRKTKEYKAAMSAFHNLSNLPLATLGYAIQEAGKDVQAEKERLKK